MRYGLNGGRVKGGRRERERKVDRTKKGLEEKELTSANN